MACLSPAGLLAGVKTDSVPCGATIQYADQPKFTCTLAAGHKGPHFDAEGPVSWFCDIAAIPPRTW